VPVEGNIGKIANAIEAGRTAASNIDYGTINQQSVININNNRFTADWQNNTEDPNYFIFGLDQWALPSKKVTQ